jgi:ubiquinone/menaquinone biosynthesis C-methylase UbiE
LGLYARFVLPLLIDLAMGSRRLEPLRAALVGQARGRVLEIGIGSGRNLPFYRRDLELLHGVDPSAELLSRARRAASWVHFDVLLGQHGAEDLPQADASFDTALVTFALCSVDDPARVLAETRRVLRPGGRLLFVEHGRSDDPRLAGWQERLTPVWSRIAGGCRLDRDMAELIRGAGFRIEALERGHPIGGPRLFTHLFKGVARR